MIKITYGMAGAFLGAFVGGIIVMAVVVLTNDFVEYRKEMRKAREKLRRREAMHEYHPDYCDGNIGTKREESQNEKEPGKERAQKKRA